MNVEAIQPEVQRKFVAAVWRGGSEQEPAGSPPQPVQVQAGLVACSSIHRREEVAQANGG